MRLCSACDHIDKRRVKDDIRELPAPCVPCLGKAMKPSFIPRDPWKPVTQRPENEEVMPEAGIKKDQGKMPWNLLMRDFALALRGMVAVLAFGMRKGYAADNWKRVEAERYRAALYRHLHEIESGNPVDDESGHPHIDHVVFNALALSQFHHEGKD
ncbi:hypothetical protein [Caulobacter phage DCM]|uniref:dATP/dGTP diphosphohydrolase N-terminal domain-containing protein n=1 Tax=Caulobacter phage DCM TaxID=3020391 RepID=A0AAE9WWQ3_9CAUD|nr:hypothetical protein [Caulobacter phage DCM]WCD56108.1 hypothetical protein [Caulobacter phage BL199]